MTIFLISLGEFHKSVTRICIHIIPEVAILFEEQWLVMDLTDTSLAFMTCYLEIKFLFYVVV